MKPLNIIAVASAFAALLAQPAFAQVASDPTRPPPAMLSNTPGSDAQTGAPLLQTVMIGPAGRSAIIGGEIVKLGGKYGDARVIKITENEVVLRSATGTETLHLHADVEIKPVVIAQPAAAKATVKKKRAAAINSQGTPK